MKPMTTIQVEKSTVVVLERLKRKFNATSYNAVIQRLAEKEVKIPKSLKGAFPALIGFQREEDDEYRKY